tara:strand:+ start:49304 stop:49948 length:645 start_codon:yes stop_codon:yes gene_type:complete
MRLTAALNFKGIKMKKVLLREYYQLCEGGTCMDLLTEQEKSYVTNGGMILTGPMQRADTVNGNGRIYPLGVLVKEVENYKKIVKERRALGELDHPSGEVISLQTASHIVTDIWMDGKEVMGKIRVLNTPSGMILKALVNDEVNVGISSRGVGSVTERNGQTIVEDDFSLIAFDMVSEPSTAGAFMMMKEAKEYKNNVFTKADRINRILNDILSE